MPTCSHGRDAAECALCAENLANTCTVCGERPARSPHKLAVVPTDNGPVCRDCIERHVVAVKSFGGSVLLDRLTYLEEAMHAVEHYIKNTHYTAALKSARAALGED